MTVLNCSNSVKYNIKHLQGSTGERMSQRLFREVIYIEDMHNRYELSVIRTDQNESSDTASFVYRWARVVHPIQFPLVGMTQIPLPDSHVEILYSNLNWDEIKWGTDSIEIRNQVFPNLMIYFFAERVPSTHTSLPDSSTSSSHHPTLVNSSSSSVHPTISTTATTSSLAAVAPIQQASNNGGDESSNVSVEEEEYQQQQQQNDDSGSESQLHENNSSSL